VEERRATEDNKDTAATRLGYTTGSSSDPNHKIQGSFLALYFVVS
jgi:hypothetical protein